MRTRRRWGDRAPPPAERSADRVYRENDEWFFRTREGKAMGPFASENDAREGLGDFIEFLTHAPEKARDSFTRSLEVPGRDGDAS